MTNLEFKKFLRAHSACSNGYNSVGDQTAEQVYNTCERPDWLMWWFSAAHRDKLPGYPSIESIKISALQIAQLVLKFNTDERLKQGLDLIEEYLKTNNQESLNKGRSLIIEARQDAYKKRLAADAAYAAAAAAYAAAAAADAAYAAADAAYAAADAAYAAADAAYAAAYAAYAAAAVKEIRKQACEIIRNNCKIDFTNNG